MFPNFHTAPTNPPQSTPDGPSTRYKCLKGDKWGRCLCEYHCCTRHTNCRELSCDHCTEAGHLIQPDPPQPPVWDVKTVVTSETPPRYLTELTFGKLTVLMTPEGCQQLGVTLIEAGYHCSHIEGMQGVGTTAQE